MSTSCYCILAPAAALHVCRRCWRHCQRQNQRVHAHHRAAQEGDRGAHIAALLPWQLLQSATQLPANCCADQSNEQLTVACHVNCSLSNECNDRPWHAACTCLLLGTHNLLHPSHTKPAAISRQAKPCCVQGCTGPCSLTGHPVRLCKAESLSRDPQ